MPRTRLPRIQTIATIAVNLPILQPAQLEKMDAWLRSVLWESEAPGQEDRTDSLEIHRLKARLVFSNGAVKMVQGVREVFEIVDGQKASDEGPLAGKVVLIGRGVKEVDWDASLRTGLGMA